ncbi:hypothetical protein METBIDRAFT_76605 [Metschnikowia bicuspidata var. bicuspidata NRRL YB-4993]|uniref:Enhancer of polycomb-like protein n=1 Tax=Metschnikowia bicuspidata var. bicuspidata NRRL YB-4993 TaxID=869754 RepID=A0A1A0HHX9_9ASCO|nr:hypothetical protein METBIDRAFT_76605 [Metschnikowia bicuspidata var. bicuspidata NRRL YB-4993]OBA23615.1 hypothetical protein METBIDRAFT_76605 [Metschnikowia bicuspidata var. bicuspidata NRRL YB-4993]
MAVLTSKAAGAGKAAAGARFRQRKISVKISLPIYNASEISGTDQDLEPSQLHHLNASAQQSRDLHTVETGVDKNEEDEVHLQQVINAAQRVLLGSNNESDKGKELSSVYIPTPDASKTWPDAKKYYSDEAFIEPESYIKFSATVEDTLGIEYNMDEEDEAFFNEAFASDTDKSGAKQELKKTNELAKPSLEAGSNRSCTMLEFEAICDKFEKKIEERQPFLSMDPTNILSYKELSSLIIEEFNSSATSDFSIAQTGLDQKYISTSTIKEKLSKELGFAPFVTTFDKNQQSTLGIRSIPKLLKLFGEPIYNHWRKRKIARKGKSITPTLKFEDPNANEKDNDNDPYVCFRRREFRQARKTRRADNLGAERIRMLQKSLKRAREIIFSVCKREILKLENWEADHEIFRLRTEAKGVKRLVGIKGDDHLFYPHKRKKIIKIEPEEEEQIEAPKFKKEKKKQQDTVPSFTQSKESGNFNGQSQPEASSTQPYVKLPPSKIPDMDLVTVSFVINEKTEAIKRAVLEKLKKRKESDKGFVNITYDPHQPFFNISTNRENKQLELSHIPYSSIAASHYHQFNTTNVIDDQVVKALEDGSKAFPGVKSFSGASGELVPSRNFPHLHSLLTKHLNLKLDESSSYIAQLLSNVENNDFSSYTKGFKKLMDDESDTMDDTSEPIFRLRKRLGRANRTFIDRRGLVARPDDAIDEWLNFSDSDEEPNANLIDKSSEFAERLKLKDAYHNKKDAVLRLDSRWKFDEDYPDYDRGIRDPFSLNPSKLNSISDDTQSIRFGSMLLSKSYDLLRESAHQRQALIQQAKIRALQQQQLQRRLSANSPYRKTLSQGSYTANINKVGNSAGRTQPYTAQQLLAMQQYKQQQNQQMQSQGTLTQKRTTPAIVHRANAVSATPKIAGDAKKLHPDRL